MMVARRGARLPRLAPYGFLLPAAALFLAFFAAPAGYAIWISLRTSKVSGGGIGLKVEQFAGLDAYQEILSDGEFWAGLGRMLAYSAIVVPVMIGLALLFALLLDTPLPWAARFARFSIFLPYAVPGVVATLLWGFLYLPGVSPLADITEALGLGRFTPLTHDFLYLAVANVAVWGGTGFNMVVLYTSLRAIPSEIYDAARIDGCGEWRMARSIKLPLLTPALVMTLLFSTISTLQVFNEPMTLKPLTNVISTTWTPMMKVYRDGFINADPYTAAAGAIILGAASLVLSLSALRLVQRRAFGEDR
jgi:multiple sugar transport system permease protein